MEYSLSDKILVTGAGGFIGSHLVERLTLEGYAVRAFVHYGSDGGWGNLEKLPEHLLKNVNVILGDISDPFSVETAVKGCTQVFHLAALIGIPYSYVAPHSYVATNVTGTLNVLEAARKHDVAKVIHTSTSETYGSAQYVPIDELHPVVGQSPYSASKIGADKLAESFWLSFKTPVVTVRPFNTYGPRQSMRAIIPTIIGQALTRNKLQLGNLEPVRDLTFVSDTVGGLIAASVADAVEGQVFNLGVGNGISIRELVEAIGDLLGGELKVVAEKDRVRPVASEVMRLISNNSKARDQIDWRPQVSLQDGLQMTIDYMRENLGAYRTDTYTI